MPRKFPVKEEVSISRREGAGEEVIIQYPFVGAPSNYVSCAAAYEQVRIPQVLLTRVTRQGVWRQDTR